MTSAEIRIKHDANTTRIDQIMNGRKMGELSLNEQREVFKLGMACIAIEMGAKPENIHFFPEPTVANGQADVFSAIANATRP